MRFQTVIFDCDSTLSAVEGIEELARGHREEVTRLTAMAMEGKIPLEEVYGRRLALIQPTRAQVDAVGDLYIERLVPGALEAIRTLASRGVTIQVLSGGLAPAVRGVASHLGITISRVAAVDIYFDSAGAYAGFEESSPLARSGGKRHWVEQHGKSLPRPILLVGDGATDLEARPAIDAFAAFTGVVSRPDVVRQADYVVNGPSLIGILPIVLPGS